MMIHWVGIGEVKAAGNGDQLGIILGSCVTAVLWHAERRFAVMNHVLLPQVPSNRKTNGTDGRYAADSWRLMQARLARQGISLRECEAHVAGGARVMDSIVNGIGEQNVDAVLALLDASRVPVRTMHVGGLGYRTARFDLGTGMLKVMHDPHAFTRPVTQAA